MGPLELRGLFCCRSKSDSAEQYYPPSDHVTDATSQCFLLRLERIGRHQSVFEWKQSHLGEWRQWHSRAAILHSNEVHTDQTRLPTLQVQWLPGGEHCGPHASRDASKAKFSQRHHREFEFKDNRISGDRGGVTTTFDQWTSTRAGHVCHQTYSWLEDYPLWTKVRVGRDISSHNLIHLIVLEFPICWTIRRTNWLVEASTRLSTDKMCCCWRNAT